MEGKRVKWKRVEMVGKIKEKKWRIKWKMEEIKEKNRKKQRKTERN